MHQRSALAVIDAVLVRGLIPLWVLAGAVFKLIERNPGLLPSQIIAWAKARGHTDWLSPFMRFAIGVEIVAAAIMIFVPRLSRTVAIAILSFFCVILLIEVRAGARSCGCMGNITMPPTVMLAIDGGLLVAAIALGIALRMQASKTAPPTPRKSAVPGIAIASVISVVGIVIALAVPERTATEVPVEPDAPPRIAENDTTPPQNGSTTPTPPAQDLPPGTIANPKPAPLPGFYMPSDPSAWVGMTATQVDLVKLMRTWPEDIATGTRHIIFYSRTCDHCEMMFHDHLMYPHDRPVTVVEIPFNRTRMRGPGAWDMPEVDVQQLQLPVGSDWVMTPPLIITIENGTVTCAQEGSYEDCLGVEPTHAH